MTARKRRRSARVLEGIGLVLCVLILVAWGVSLAWYFAFTGDGWSCGCRDGVIVVLSSVVIGRTDAGTWKMGSLRRPNRWGLEWPVARKQGKVVIRVLMIPLWLPFVAVAIPTGLLWFLERRRRIPEGHCVKCEYNLMGNESGTCPECRGTRQSPVRGVRT